MAEGWGPTGANAALDALLTAYPWMKMHTGAPGAGGSSNAAVETTRKQVTWGSAAAGAASNTAAVVWTSVPAAEDWTHASFHSASTAGTFGFSGTVTGNALQIGDTARIEIGDIDVTLTLAS